MIWKFLNGDELTDDELDRVSLHVAECDLCAERLANLAELGDAMPELMLLETPPAGLADRIMSEIEQDRQQAACGPYTTADGAHCGSSETEWSNQTLETNNVVPLAPRKARSPRLELFTRVATAAVVTGFMVLGSAGQSYADRVPVFGKTIAAVSNTGSFVSNGTARVYSELYDLFSVANFDRSK
ncbi:hypothetical protein CIG75_04915 [Tumebacillus algifaecis]|uniref:Zinc-finger domain-containing protein n=2 Tax=Tumebacillus algifaecis TaxID=1214604 RepID=A0A223CYB1_9BACL|nr:hypothetical protein CIG75_04915 [Tumebacillus algifaecis]